MFRKLVSNLSFSSSLVGQLGFYAKRLRKEEATRRIGLIFTVLALIVQSFAVFTPPEAVNASSPANMIPGGVKSLQEYINHYDQNTNNIKDLFTEIGITRDNIVSAKKTTVNSKDIPFSFGMTSRFSASQGTRSYVVKTSSGASRTFYYNPLSLYDSLAYTIKNGSTYDAYQGVSSKGQWFALMNVCGNLLLKTTPPVLKCPTNMIGTYPKCTVPPKMCTYPGKTNLLESDKECRPTPKCTIPGKTSLDSTDPNCKPDPVATCSALQVTKINDKYELNGEAAASHGATITSYTYVVKRDGQVVDTIKTKSDANKNSKAFTTQTIQGNYTVELTVHTSVGDRTGPNCTKRFNIPAPKMCIFNPSILEISPECQPCPGDSNIWIKDDKCTAKVLYTKNAANITQGNSDASKTTTHRGDKIVYTLNIENTGKAPIDITPKDDLSDLLEYADVIDTGGGEYIKDEQVLTWGTINIKPGEKQIRMFTVKIMDTIPAIGMGISNKTSYDCRIDNTFGNITGINIDCPKQKQFVEQTVSELPHTGPRENMIFAGITMALVAYFYARSRQMKKEIRLIRRDLNAGTI